MVSTTLGDNPIRLIVDTLTRETSVGIALSNPGTFRACLLMTALNYSWLSAPGSLQSTDMEETYLYHKLEAMRLVNDQIADPMQSTSDGCLSLIATLAFVEVRSLALPFNLEPCSVC